MLAPFAMTDALGEPRELKFAICNTAFHDRRINCLDGSSLLTEVGRELAIYANRPPDTRSCITDAELEDYRAAHAPARL
jgi:hypothetical protein